MNIRNITVRSVTIGEGMPKLCVPVVAKNRESILSYVERVLEVKPDLVELRMDWFEGVTNAEAMRSLLQEIRQIAGDTVLLFTIRTSGEGGELAVNVEDYKRLCTLACESGCIDLLDVEAYIGDGVLDLLSATVTYYEQGMHNPVIAMAMGGVGVISRLAGEFFGSAVTFASEGQISAPGQIPVQEAKQIIQILHEYR